MTLPAENPSDSPTALPPTSDLRALRREIITYRRLLPQLLAEGHEGRFVLIKGEDVLGIWDNFEDAQQAGALQFGFGPFLAQPIDSRDQARPFPKEFDPSQPG